MGKDANGAAPERSGGLYGRLVVLVRLVLVLGRSGRSIDLVSSDVEVIFFRRRGARAKEGDTCIFQDQVTTATFS